MRKVHSIPARKSVVEDAIKMQHNKEYRTLQAHISKAMLSRDMLNTRPWDASDIATPAPVENAQVLEIMKAMYYGWWSREEQRRKEHKAPTITDQDVAGCIQMMYYLFTNNTREFLKIVKSFRNKSDNSALADYSEREMKRDEKMNLTRLAIENEMLEVPAEINEISQREMVTQTHDQPQPTQEPQGQVPTGPLSTPQTAPQAHQPVRFVADQIARWENALNTNTYMMRRTVRQVHIERGVAGGGAASSSTGASIEFAQEEIQDVFLQERVIHPGNWVWM